MVDFDFNGKVDPLELLLTMEMISANPDSARRPGRRGRRG